MHCITDSKIFQVDFFVFWVSDGENPFLFDCFIFWCLFNDDFYEYDNLQNRVDPNIVELFKSDIENIDNCFTEEVWKGLKMSPIDVSSVWKSWKFIAQIFESIRIIFLRKNVYKLYTPLDWMYDIICWITWIMFLSRIHRLKFQNISQ